MVKKVLIGGWILVAALTAHTTQASDLTSVNLADTSRIADYLDKTYYFYNDAESDSSLFYATQALELSREVYHVVQETANPQEINSVTSYLSVSYETYARMLRSYDIRAARDTLYAALNLFEDVDESEKGGLYSVLGTTFEQMGQPEKALEYSKKALSSFEASGDRYDYMYQLTNTGLILRGLGQYGESLELFVESLAIGHELQDSSNIVESLLAMGFVYAFVEKWDQAIESQKEALKIYEAAGDQSGVARIHNDMGVTYYFADELDSSLIQHRKALELRLDTKNSYDKFSSYTYIADIQAIQGDIEGAIENYEQALELGSEIGFKTSVVDVNIQLGSVYLAKPNNNAAKEKFEAALELSKEIGDLTGESRARMYLAQVAMLNNDYNEAITQLKRAEEIAPSSNLQIRERLYKEIADTYYNLGDYKNAYLNSLIFSEVKDSALSAENRSQIAKMSNVMEFENELALKKENNEKLMAIKQAEVNREKFTRNIFLAGMIFSVILVGITFIRFVEKKKLSTKLNETLTNLRATQTQLIHSEKMASLGELTAGIAHEIQNPLNFVNNFAEVSGELIDEATEELLSGNDEDVKEILYDVRNNLSKITHHGKRADSIIKGMLQHSRGGTGKLEPSELNPLVKEFVNLSFHGMRAGKEPINVDIHYEMDQKVGQVPLIAEDFSRVILNLCNNAFDAMREKMKSKEAMQSSEDFSPELTVRTLRDDTHVRIEIADNGPGIPEEIKDKILQPFFTTKKGTAGTGLGLSITNDIVKAHGGSLSIVDNTDSGSTFIITLPTQAGTS